VKLFGQGSASLALGETANRRPVLNSRVHLRTSDLPLVESEAIASSAGLSLVSPTRSVAVRLRYFLGGLRQCITAITLVVILCAGICVSPIKAKVAAHLIGHFRV
jgi:hypothetical protein